MKGMWMIAALVVPLGAMPGGPRPAAGQDAAAKAPPAATLKGGEVVPLWPAERLAPSTGKPEEAVTVKRKIGGTIIKVGHVRKPTITVYRPAGASAAAPAVIICPGGGYHILAWDLEGTEIAAWLNSLGVTGVLLKYRVPRQRDAAFQDAQRAVGLVRGRAKEWGIDPRRIGILGFSAGGHLAARASTNYRKRTYERVDGHDDVSCRPDFTVLIYPAYLTTAGDAALDAAALPVDSDTPPAFLAVAASDKFTGASLHYALALKKAKVRAEVHVFHSGGHGCGLRPSAAAVTTWPTHCARWLRDIKVLPPAAR